MDRERLAKELVADVRRALSTKVHQRDGNNGSITTIENFINEPDVPAALEKTFEETLKQEDIHDRVSDRKMRGWVAFVILLIFTLLNGVVLLLVFKQVDFDNVSIANNLYGADKRLITENTFMSLIGATVVQAAVALLAITRHLFPTSRNTKSIEKGNRE